jgi:hypothetical protein
MTFLLGFDLFIFFGKNFKHQKCEEKNSALKINPKFFFFSWKAIPYLLNYFNICTSE